ncbi:MAG: methyltransferase [Pseudoruegeria sp.]
MLASLTQDLFLGGKVKVWQPVNGYRAGADPVFLAAATPALSGQSVLELGCGAGTASLCLGRRVADLTLTGVEVQEEYADLARRNATENGLKLSVHTADLCALPDAVKQQSYDHVIANPPYYLSDRGKMAREAGKNRALWEDTPLSEWLMAAAKRLAPKGVLSVIQDAPRLPDLFAAMPSQLGSIEVLPLAAREGRRARRVLLRARKSGNAEFCLHSGVSLHDGASHTSDRDDYSDRIRGVLRDGAPLEFPAIHSKDGRKSV